MFCSIQRFSAKELAFQELPQHYEKLHSTVMTNNQDSCYTKMKWSEFDNICTNIYTYAYIYIYKSLSYAIFNNL